MKILVGNKLKGTLRNRIMNKNISELIDEAARQYEDELGVTECLHFMRIYYDRAMEIFAEMIISECISVIDEIHGSHKMGRRPSPYADIVDKIELYFGVE